MNGPWTWTILLALAGAFAVWRGVTHVRGKRSAFAIVLFFVALFCFYEAVMRAIETQA